jgi:hypothetical protein
MKYSTNASEGNGQRPKVCIDRILPQDLSVPQKVLKTSRGPARGIAPIGKTWMNGTELTVRFLGGSARQQAIVKEQAAWWQEVANLKFKFSDSTNAQIRISFDETDGAWSYIGTDCTRIPVNQATMNLGFIDGGTAAHEFGHAIGLAHEHQNPAGGIEWNEEVVIREAAKSPNFWNEATTRHNILNKYRVDQIKGTAFDKDSIMLYFFPGSWTKSGQGTSANEILSKIDKTFIAGANMYPKTSPTTVDATELIVNAKRATSASIGKFGEEDLFRFNAADVGNYIIETKGPTDVVMKLFGPNSETALIAEDDDSGSSRNARIERNLLPGTYYVQVRHYNRAKGKGNYSVKVRKA